MRIGLHRTIQRTQRKVTVAVESSRVFSQIAGAEPERQTFISARHHAAKSCGMAGDQAVSSLCDRAIDHLPCSVTALPHLARRLSVITIRYRTARGAVLRSRAIATWRLLEAIMTQPAHATPEVAWCATMVSSLSVFPYPPSPHHPQRRGSSKGRGYGDKRNSGRPSRPPDLIRPDHDGENSSAMAEPPGIIDPMFGRPE